MLRSVATIAKLVPRPAYQAVRRVCQHLDVLVVLEKRRRVPTQFVGTVLWLNVHVFLLVDDYW
jgi:hypothetical protein